MRIFFFYWLPKLDARRQEPRYARLRLCTPHCGGASPFCGPRREKDHSGLFLLPAFSSNSLKRKKNKGRTFVLSLFSWLPKLDSNQRPTD